MELNNDLIDLCRPGDIILLVCWVDAVNSALAAGRAGKRAQETSTYKLFLYAHSITTLSESNSQVRKLGSGSTTDGNAQTTFTTQQLQSITQLCFGIANARLSAQTSNDINLQIL